MSNEKVIYRNVEMSIGIGATVEMALNGRFFQILSNSSDAILTSLNNRPEVLLQAGIAVQSPLGERLERVRFNNNTDSIITLEYAYGEEAFYDNRLLLQSGGAITTRSGNTIANSAVAVNDAATLISAADSDKTRITIQAGDIDIFVGDANVTVLNGVKITAGGAYSLDSGAAIYGITATDTSDVRVLEEFN